MHIPKIITKIDGNSVLIDLNDYNFVRKREICLNYVIDDEVAASICAQLRYLATKNSDDINLYINSPGGSVTAGMAIYDTMQYIKPDVSTICIGMAASMGAILLAGGAKGKRYALPNAEVMIHQPSGDASGQATDIYIHAEKILRTKQKLNKLLAENTGKSVEEVERDTERDNFMTAEEARAYGLIDEILYPSNKGGEK